MFRRFFAAALFCLMSVTSFAQDSDNNADTRPIVSHTDDEHVFYRNPAYARLTTDNLAGFIAEWKAYSHFVDQANRQLCRNDSLICKLACYNPEHNDILAQNFEDVPPCDMRKYVVVRQTILVDSSTKGPDGIMIYDSKEITPYLPENGLYLNDAIESKLAEYIGGVTMDNSELTSFSEENLNVLNEYLPVDFGRWGNNWQFVTYPSIESITVTDTGVDLRYKATSKEGGKLRVKKVGNMWLPETTVYDMWME